MSRIERFLEAQNDDGGLASGEGEVTAFALAIELYLKETGKSLKEDQREALFELFPKITLPIKDIDKIKEKYYLTDYNENMTNKYATGGNRPDESEEQDDRPRQQVSCQNQ